MHGRNGYVSGLQQSACEAFPNADLLPIALSDGRAVTQAVENRTTGNSLFDFVFIETSDLDDLDTGEAYFRLRRAAGVLRYIADSLYDDNGMTMEDVHIMMRFGFGYRPQADLRTAEPTDEDARIIGGRARCRAYWNTLNL